MNEQLQGWKRTDYCAKFSVDNIGDSVTLMGWVQKRRDLGALIFVDLRDRSGLMQVVFDASVFTGDFEQAEHIRSEFVVAVQGKIVKREEETINEKLPTGLIEVKAQALKILSEAKTPPFEIEEAAKVRDEVRLKYRYLDLRRPELQEMLMLRHKIAHTAREYFNQNGFLEIETPMLIKSTPEGARDYLVPSRVHPGTFYALPQSPQIYKQILMVSGYDRYYQIVRCFRDEDLRADRQPEFTQIDLEMSFVEIDDVISVNEGLMKQLFKVCMNMEIQTPFKRITYKEAMERYGSDKPDTRFGLELVNVSDYVKDTEFKVFATVVQNGGSVRAINVKGAVEAFARREIDALVDFVKIYGAKGMAWISMKADGIQSPITKFFKEDELDALLKAVKAETGDIIFFIGDTEKVVFDSLGNLRLKLAEKLGMIPEDTYDLLWVTEFPVFEYSEEEKRYTAMHHPFTSPMDEDIDYLDGDIGKMRAKAYDLVLNGNEIAGGSIRIHDSKVQEKMFKALGFSDAQAQERFGFMLEALKYGTPPHGGMAYGLDRLTMLMGKRESIKDVIAFPKVQNASCLMSEAPAAVEMKQLRELSLQIKESKE